jgi:hypothetical protein
MDMSSFWIEAIRVRSLLKEQARSICVGRVCDRSSEPLGAAISGLPIGFPSAGRNVTCQEMTFTTYVMLGRQEAFA